MSHDRSFGVIGVIGVASCTLVLVAWSGPAGAFCRTTRCRLGGLGNVCTPTQPNESADCELPLAWRKPCVGYSIQRDDSRSISAALAGDLVTRAFDTWMSVDCGAGARPSIRLKRQPDVQCATADYNFTGGNANAIMFRDHGWPYETAQDALALTTMWFDIHTGEIFGSDIEINTTAFTFTTGDTDVTFDLLSTLQHETGHFLGLAHSPDEDATMFASPRHGSIAGRALSADDAAAICATYPPDATMLDETCEPAPRDFSSTCTSDNAGAQRSGEDGCSIVPASDHEPPSYRLLALALGAAAAIVARRLAGRRV